MSFFLISDFVLSKSRPVGKFNFPTSGYLSIWNLCWVFELSKYQTMLGNLGNPTPSKTDEFSEKFQGGREGHFQSKNLCCKIWTFKQDYLTMKFEGFVDSLTNLQHNFPKMRGGDQSPFGPFPKIHPFWKGSPSLIYLCKLNKTLQEERNYWIASMRDLSKLGEMKFRISQLKISNQPIHGWKGFWSSSYKYWLNAICFHPAIQIYIKRLNKDITRWKNAVKNMLDPSVN